MSAPAIETTAAATGPRRSSAMPPVHPWAWRSPIGEAVQRLAPTTEADPIAILVQALALFGAMVGDGPHLELGAAAHPAKIWPLIVGRTSAGRKGTSLAEARLIARSWGPYAHRYLQARQMGGLASGEGLLAALGAGQHAEKPDDEEALAPDGKLTVVETEFARVLAASKRDGSTLGPVLRQMWDGGSAAVMTRSAPLKVDGAHLAVIAHITPRELRLKLADSDLAGGTLNRFLIVASERTQLLPYEMARPELADLGRLVAGPLEDVRSWRQRIRMDREARELWAEIYAALEHDQASDGVLESVMARGGAQTQRLALCFALLDGASSLSKSHLLTGLAVWNYSAASARWLFFEQEATTPERKLAEYLASGPDGRTRTEINRFFSGNRTAEELDAMLHQGISRKLITMAIDDSNGGRRAVRYRWTGGAIDPVRQILDSYW